MNRDPLAAFHLTAGSLSSNCQRSFTYLPRAYHLAAKSLSPSRQEPITYLAAVRLIFVHHYTPARLG